MDKGEIIANVMSACQKYRQTFAPPYMFMTRVRKEAPSEEFQSADIRIKTKGEHRQCLEIFPTKVETGRRVVCRNAKYSFAISGGSTDSTWKVDDILLKGSGDLHNNLNLELHFLDVVLYSPTYVNHLRIDDLLNSPAVMVSSEVVNGDDILIKMNIADPTEQVNGFSINFFEIELFVRPNSTGWLPYRSVHRTKLPKDTFTGDINYSNYKNEHNIFVPQAMVVTLQKGNDEPWKSEDHTFAWSFENELTDKEFTLSHYGFPEPDFGERRTTRIRYVLMAIGALLIAFAIWQMYQKRKEQKI